MSDLLQGVKVIDAASFIAGPAAATVMADFGAEVIKLEPPGGDAYRHLRDAPGNPPAAVNYAWMLDNRSKRGLMLDLKKPAGQDLLYRLVAHTDVFVTNTPLPARVRLGITYDRLSAVNPRLVYASLTAYGEDGPEANNTGFDSTALWARTSLMDMVRAEPDGPPARSLPGMGDHPTAISLFGSIMAALYRRERTGEGAYVHTSLLANGVWWNAVQIQAALCGSRYARRPAREDATSAVHNLYQSRDGRWFHLVLIPEEKRWAPFLSAIERPDLADDPRFATSEARHRNPRALIEVLDQVFGARDWAHWQGALEQHGITYGLVGTLDDVASDVQMRESGTLIPTAGPGAGAELTVNSPVWVEETPKRAPAAAPGIGEHTTDILREAGIEPGEIERLRSAGIIG